ncbi:MAG: hypothetical protein KF779_07795 [Hyphomonadaceae bacterium]|nr:hypothetical protein [Hyphomonadaceae bacterium]
MASIKRCALPDEALLRGYAERGAYTDCFAVDVAASVSFAAFVEAFYTSAAFRCERFVLTWVVAKPSSDDEARRLARGEAERFAAWTVEARAPDQFLACDYLRRTRSWLMVAPTKGGTRLYFGTAVVPVGFGSGGGRLGFPFNALLPFHKLYARILLGAARGRALKQVRL